MPVSKMSAEECEQAVLDALAALGGVAFHEDLLDALEARRAWQASNTPLHMRQAGRLHSRMVWVAAEDTAKVQYKLLDVPWPD